jgi:hypothetical protein
MDFTHGEVELYWGSNKKGLGNKEIHQTYLFFFRKINSNFIALAYMEGLT